MFLGRGTRTREENSSLARVVVNEPCSANRRQGESWFGETPCRQGNKAARGDAWRVSATISSFSATDQRRRRIRESAELGRAATRMRAL